MALDTISFKLVVTGPFGAGKTTLIQAISETPVVATEVPSGEARGGGTTTVSMDFGTRVVPGGPGEPAVELLMFGTPGQDRFAFMRQILARGLDGLLLLVDASEPSTWREAAAILASFDRPPGTPLVVGANRAVPGQPLAKLAEELEVSRRVPLVACNVIEASSAREVVLVLLEEILAHVGD